MSKAKDRTMGKWAKEKRDALPKRIKVLIMLAKWDLYYGPIGSQEDANNLQDEPFESWPGFHGAVEEIKAALDDIGDVVADINAEEVLDKEPEGEMVDNPDYDPDEEEDEKDNPKQVWQEPEWSDYCKVDRKEAISYIVGDNELASHL
jgi:hypothetical protein